MRHARLVELRRHHPDVVRQRAPDLGANVEPVGMDAVVVGDQDAHHLYVVVMAGLVPAIHVFLALMAKTWMPGTRPGMTRLVAGLRNHCLLSITFVPPM